MLSRLIGKCIIATQARLGAIARHRLHCAVHSSIIIDCYYISTVISERKIGGTLISAVKNAFKLLTSAFDNHRRVVHTLNKLSQNLSIKDKSYP